MINCFKKISGCILILVVLFLFSGCAKKESFQIKDAFNKVIKKTEEKPPQKTIPNIIYLGNSGKTDYNAEFKEISFDFKDLKRR